MYVSIKQSSSSGKKMMAIFFDVNKKKIKTTHFGASGYEDYTGHQDLQRKIELSIQKDMRKRRIGMIT